MHSSKSRIYLGYGWDPRPEESTFTRKRSGKSKNPNGRFTAARRTFPKVTWVILEKDPTVSWTESVQSRCNLKRFQWCQTQHQVQLVFAHPPTRNLRISLASHSFALRPIGPKVRMGSRVISPGRWLRSHPHLSESKPRALSGVSTPD